jgi:hypothetical protein
VSWSNAFKDAKGDWNIAECTAAPAAAGGILMWLWKTLHHPEIPDLSSFGIGIGSLIAALAAAQRLRGDTDLDKEHRGDRDVGERH